MSHPIEPNAESMRDVFRALMDHVEIASDWDQTDRREWQARWDRAAAVARRRRAYDRKYDDALLGVTRYGQ